MHSASVDIEETNIEETLFFSKVRRLIEHPASIEETLFFRKYDDSSNILQDLDFSGAKCKAVDKIITAENHRSAKASILLSGP